MCQDTFEKLRREQAAKTEQVYAAALAGGTCGVSEIESQLTIDQADTWDMTLRARQIVRVDPRVPYGQRYVFPSLAVYEAWVADQQVEQ